MVDENAFIVGIRVNGDSQGFDLSRCCAELQPPSLEVEVIDVQSGGIQNGEGPPRNLDHIVFFPQRIGDEQREMDRVGLIDRIKVKINAPVKRSLRVHRSTTFPTYIAVDVLGTKPTTLHGPPVLDLVD